MDEHNRHTEVDALLKRILSEDKKSSYYQLHELFEQRLAYLDITKHQALNILQLDHKKLESILTGDSKKVDFVTIVKLSDFLEIPHDEIVEKYFQLVRDAHNDDIASAKKRSFIVNHFNLPSLKKIGLIDSINDFEHIETRINEFLGYESIFEHSKHEITAAFSSGKRKTNKENLSLWYAAACQSLEKTPNPNAFDRDGIKDFFPKIRWHSLNVSKGLALVAQALFKLGVTLIIVPKFTSDVHSKGATLAYRDKPCIVLTIYTRFYGTMWFTLIHEIFHVLYDWDEILEQRYHISGETESMKINEREADRFARQYLFSDEKMAVARPRINDPIFIRHLAEQSHVHPSVIYTFYNWDNEGENTYGKFSKYMPDFSEVLEHFRTDDFLKFTPVKQITVERNLHLFPL